MEQEEDGMFFVNEMNGHGHGRDQNVLRRDFCRNGNHLRLTTSTCVGRPVGAFGKTVQAGTSTSDGYLDV